MSDPAIMDVQALGQVGVIQHRLTPAFAGQREDERQGRVGEGESGGAGDGARHVGDAVMDDAVLHVGRIGMGGRPAGFEAATLVDGNVDQHRTRPHPADHVVGNQFGCGGAGYKHGADDQIGGQDCLLDRSSGGEQCRGPRSELQVQFLQARQ